MVVHKFKDNMPLIEMVHAVLVKEKKPRTFYELVDVLPDQSNYSKEVQQDRIARLYTNMNLDGRFLSVGDNFWGLKKWYPIEQREEDVAATLAPKRRKKRKKKPVELEDEDIEEIEEDHDDDDDLDDDFDDDFDDDDSDDDDDDDDDDDK